jgi:ATP-dependent Clp protease ATP-binding subunit ClpC
MRTGDRLKVVAIKTINRARRAAFGCTWTPCAAQVAALSRKEAVTLKHDCAQEIHFTIALGHLGQGLAAERLKDLGFQYDSALLQAQAIAGTGTSTLQSTSIPFSDGAKQMVMDAKALSLRDGLWWLGTDHLFLALLRKPERLLRQLIEAKGLVFDKFRRQIEDEWQNTAEDSILNPGKHAEKAPEK